MKSQHLDHGRAEYTEASLECGHSCFTELQESEYLHS